MDFDTFMALPTFVKQAIGAVVFCFVMMISLSSKF
jgi:hypothetical protein